MEREGELEDRQPLQSTKNTTTTTLPTFQEYLAARKREVEHIYGEIPDNYRGYELLMEIDDEGAIAFPEIVTQSECMPCTSQLMEGWVHRKTSSSYFTVNALHGDLV